MKTMNSLIVATMLIAGTTLMAQTQTTRTNNYADQAFKQTSQLVNTLNLSDEQTVEILAINQKYADMDVYRTGNGQPSKKELRKAKRNSITAQAKEIKSVLKGYQKEKFEYMVINHEVLVPQFNPMMAFNNAPQRSRKQTADIAPRRISAQTANRFAQRMPFRSPAPGAYNIR